jgi:hypothetical protein
MIWQQAGPAVAEPEHRAVAAEGFDAVFYMAEYADAAEAGLDPLDHFLLRGWREGRNPSRLFDVSYYLKMNVDVARNGVNPLLHYLWVGRREGRAPCRKLDSARRQLQAASAPRDRAQFWAGVADNAPAMLARRLDAQLAAALHLTGQQGLVVSVSHDDYALNHGGVQKLIEAEREKLNATGWSYLHLSPAAPLPMLAPVADVEGFRLALRLDGERLGVALGADVLATLAAARRGGTCIEVVFHHLMGHAPEFLAALPDAAGAQALSWVHDFFTLCPSYALMRNDITYCAAPPVQSAGCRICAYGEDRAPHVPRVAAFYAKTRPFVLAPSGSALEIWRGAGLDHTGTDVVPLARLLFDDSEPVARRAGGALRVAHVGSRSLFKGWAVFEALAHAHAKDDRYCFYQLGVDGQVTLPGCIAHVPVRVGPAQPDAMIEAVAEHRIDVVVSWSLWPETFCFAVHEALAGGAFVIARGASGNVPKVIAASAAGRGCVIENDGDLRALFASGAIIPLARQSARRYGAVLAQGGTADWLLDRFAAGRAIERAVA